MTIDIPAARAIIAARGECAGPLTTFPEPGSARVAILCRDNWDDVIRWLDLCERKLPAALDRIEELERLLAEARLAAKFAEERNAALAERDEARAEVERLTGAGFAAMNPATVAEIIAERDHYRSIAEATSETVESRVVEIIDATLLGPTEPPPNMSAEFARVVRAVRVNVVMRERLEAKCAALKDKLDGVPRFIANIEQRTVDVEARVVEGIAKWLSTQEPGYAQITLALASQIRSGAWKAKS